MMHFSKMSRKLHSDNTDEICLYNNLTKINFLLFITVNKRCNKTFMLNIFYHILSYELNREKNNKKMHKIYYLK